MGDSISGYRSQIFGKSHSFHFASISDITTANAVQIFPKVFNDRGKFPSTEEHGVFDIIIFAEKHQLYKFQAVLLYGDPDNRKTAAYAEATNSPEHALRSLLCLTTVMLGANRAVAARVMREKKVVAHGYVDEALL